MDVKEFIKKECPKCKNKNTQLCKIVYNINGDAQCQFYIEKEKI